MAATPKYKIYDAQGTYQASCKRAEDAACLVAFFGDGAKIKLSAGSLLWHEGQENMPAGQSYDNAAEVIHDREDAVWNKVFKR